jgi:phage shock protein A
LKDDADAIRRVRVQLQQEIVRLTEEEQRVTVAQEFAASSAVKFRNAFTAGRFPALVAGSVWSRDQVESQVSSLLAQVAGFDATLVRLRSGRIQAESELERLTIQLADTESSVTLLGTQGEVLRARRDAQPRTEQLVNRVDELVNPRGLESI